MDKYDHKQIEKKWQKSWSKDKLYEVKDEEKDPSSAKPPSHKASDGHRATEGKKDSGKLKENFYQLVEFPYPSGNLHVGHWYAFSVPDIFVRAKRMQGFNVLYPMGFDAFGLPAENAAIKNNTNPRKWTEGNIEYMIKQIETMGTSFDWSRTVSTTDPEYYRWTQWMFLEFFKNGLAYQGDTFVNWCPSCKTVLANEQVVGGLCERCSSEVEQKVMKQWQLRISDYAEDLLKDLDELEWPEAIKDGQRNWIGKSEGALLEFGIKSPESRIKRFIILHGRGGSVKRNFLPWLADSLKKKGYEVDLPQMPGSPDPNDEEQADFVQKNYTLDEHTAVIGHSFGGVVALRLLERGVKLGKVALVGTPYSGKFLDHRDRPSVTDALKKGFDFEKIKKNCPSFSAVYDTGDYVVPIEDGETFANSLNANLVKAKANEPHFAATEEPVVKSVVIPSIEVFTTRPDTIFGATYLVLAPEHKAISNFQFPISNRDEVEEYVKQAGKKTELQRMSEGKNKTGVELKGVKAINPATGEEIPVWVADYVLGSVGTGAIMAVPAHDARDNEFAKKFKLPIKQVVKPAGVVDEPIQPPSAGAWGHVNADIEADVWTGDGELVNSGEFSGKQSDEVRSEIADKFGKQETQYRMRDWIISRQRYWGVPIPLVFCENCAERIKNSESRIKNTKRQLLTERDGKEVAIIPILDKDLPVELPELEDFKPKNDGKSPLARVEKWVNVKCPECGGDARRETDTMDTFVDSSWYFLRYLDPHNKNKFADIKKLEKWMPVNRYSGGAEHTTMHLLYSRFWIKALHKLGHLPWSEPYTVRMNRSLILGPDGHKMSKSKGNVVDPDEVVADLGSDTVRMYLAFIGPYNEVNSYPWDSKGIHGIRRFLDKVWKIYSESGERSSEVGSEGLVHKLIKKVTNDIEAFKFNTAIAAMMSFLNETSGRIDKESSEIFLKLLSPFAPHMTEEIWREVLGHKTSIHLEEWPEYDESLIKEEIVKIPIQINGKVKGVIEISADAPEEVVRNAAESEEGIKKYLEGKEVKKFLYVKGKIVNFVVK